MKTSESIKEIAPALLKAQKEGNSEEESRLVPILIKLLGKNKPFTRADQNKTRKQKLLERVAMTFSDCWYWTGFIDELGYGVSSDHKVRKAHRLSWSIFNGDIPKGMKVLHKCDIRSCVNPNHLFLGTQADNVQDMISKGRQVYPTPKPGVLNPQAKLTPIKVLEIREKYKNGETLNDLTEEYGISKMTVFRAAKQISWRHI